MPRFKAFSSAICGDDVGQLERLIGEWLMTARPRISLMAQSAHGAHLVISFVYDASGVEEGGAHATAVPDAFERTMEDSDLNPAGADSGQLPEAELPY